MRNKAEIRRYKKCRIYFKLEAVTHRENARRLSLDKAGMANQEGKTLLYLGLLQALDSPCACGIVIVKSETRDLRFCSDFRPLYDLMLKEAFSLH